MEETENGDLFVSGRATDDTLDSDDQIIDADFARKGLSDWLASGANVRVMHSTNLYPAGVGVELSSDGNAQVIKAEVVEPTAKLLVKKGVLRAFSVGISRPKIVRDAHARGGRVVDGIFSEVSLVDRPANSNCKFTMCKRLTSVDDSESTIELINKLEADRDFLAKFANTTLTKGDSSDDSDDDSKDDKWHKDGSKCSDGDCDRDHSSSKPDDSDSDSDSDSKDDSDSDGGDKWHKDGSKCSDDDCDRDHSSSKPDDDQDGGGDNSERDDYDNNDKVAKGNGHRDLLSGQYATPVPGTSNVSLSRLDLSQSSSISPSLSPSAPVPQDTAASATWDRGPLVDGHQAPTPGASVTGNYSDTGQDGAAIAKNLSPEEIAAKWAAEIAARQNGDAVTTVEKRDFDPNVGGGVDRDKLPESDFAGPHKSFPIVTQKDVDDAWHLASTGHGDDPAKIKANIRRIAKKKGFKVPGDDDASKTARTYLLKRIHDATCVAYDWDDVIKTYPALEKNGLAHALGPTAQNLLFEMLQNEVSEDSGSGVNADDIHHLGKAYCAVVKFLENEQYGPLVSSPESTTASILLGDARAELRKEFLGANNGVSPTISGQPSPASYRRPYLAAGHANATASSGQHPRWPSADSQPSPDEFDRSLITEGHEASSPANKALESTSYTLTAAIGHRNAVSSAIMDVHDHISGMIPEYCSMEPPRTAGFVAAPQSGTASTVSSIEQLASQSKFGDMPELVKLAATELANDLTADLRAEIVAKQARIDELESMPDPSKAPFRGVMATKRATNAASQTQESGQTEVEAEIAWLQKYANTGNAEKRLRIGARLEKLMSDRDHLVK